MTTPPEDDWRNDEEFISYMMKQTECTREQVLESTIAGWSTWRDWSAGKASAQLPTLKVWGDEKPEEGELFMVYERNSDEPVFCEMDHGDACQIIQGLDCDTVAYGNGGTIVSDLDVEDNSRWYSVKKHTIDWSSTPL